MKIRRRPYVRIDQYLDACDGGPKETKTIVLNLIPAFANQWKEENPAYRAKVFGPFKTTRAAEWLASQGHFAWDISENWKKSRMEEAALEALIYKDEKELEAAGAEYFKSYDITKEDLG